MSGLSLETRPLNLKSVTLTVLELLPFNAHFKLVWLTGPLRTHTQTLRQRDRQTDRTTSNEHIISAIHFVNLAEIMKILMMMMLMLMMLILLLMMKMITTTYTDVMCVMRLITDGDDVLLCVDASRLQMQQRLHKPHTLQRWCQLPVIQFFLLICHFPFSIMDNFIGFGSINPASSCIVVRLFCMYVKMMIAPCGFRGPSLVSL